jgi:hypothetical protein
MNCEKLNACFFIMIRCQSNVLWGRYTRKSIVKEIRTCAPGIK